MNEQLEGSKLKWFNVTRSATNATQVTDHIAPATNVNNQPPAPMSNDSAPRIPTMATRPDGLAQQDNHMDNHMAAKARVGSDNNQTWIYRCMQDQTTHGPRPSDACGIKQQTDVTNSLHGGTEQQPGHGHSAVSGIDKQT